LVFSFNNMELLTIFSCLKRKKSLKASLLKGSNIKLYFYSIVLLVSSLTYYNLEPYSHLSRY
jgi:hypothetical protein